MAEWRAARKAQLKALPPAVQETAHIYGNGEVSWPNRDAEAAIDALVDAGFLITGIDARTHFPDGGLREIPIADYGVALYASKERGLWNADGPSVEPTPDARREVALRHLASAFEEGDYVLITYSPPGGDDAKIGLVSQT